MLSSEVEAALGVLSRIIEWNDSHGEGAPALATARAELEQLTAERNILAKWCSDFSLQYGMKTPASTYITRAKNATIITKKNNDENQR
jgi:hypothetical protein